MRRLGWLLSLVATLLLLLVPGEASARGFGRGGGRSGGKVAPPPSKILKYSKPMPGRGVYSFRGNVGRGYGYGYGYGYRGYGLGYRGYGLAGPHPYWWPYYAGWGIWPWGYYAYGYYPYWGAPPVDQAPEAYQQPKTDSFSLFLGLALPSQGVAPTGSISYDDLRWGFNLQGIGLTHTPDALAGCNCDMPLLSTHIAFSPLSTPHARWRLEAGISSIFTPGPTYVGPDIGTSGQLAIAGPLGVEAAVHYTPMPAKILDAEANVVLSFGGLGVKAGWRAIRFDDRGVQDSGGPGNNTGSLSIFTGPAVALGLTY